MPLSQRQASAKDHKACNHEAQPVADSNCWRFIAVTYPILCLSYRPNVTVAKRLEYLLTHTHREGERETHVTVRKQKQAISKYHISEYIYTYYNSYIFYV